MTIVCYSEECNASLDHAQKRKLQNKICLLVFMALSSSHSHLPIQEVIKLFALLALLDYNWGYELILKVPVGDGAVSDVRLYEL